MKKYYIGIDPDLRLLNAAIVSDDKKLQAVFIRRNKGGKGDEAVVNSFIKACRLIEDVLAWFVANTCGEYEIITIVESQNMMHAKKMRDTGKNVRYQDILVTGQVAGGLAVAFGHISKKIHLVQPMEWKKGVPKKIHHNRIYKQLFISVSPVPKISNIFPVGFKALSNWSVDNVNPGDFKDINDSLGLALYGIKKGL